MLRTRLRLLGFLFFSSNVVHAEEMSWPAMQSELTQGVEAMNNDCHHEVPVKIEKKTFDNRPKDGPSAYTCTRAMNIIQQTCGLEKWPGDNGHVAKIKKFICRGTTAKSSEFTAFKDGELTFEVGQDTNVDGIKARDFLEDRVALRAQRQAEDAEKQRVLAKQKEDQKIAERQKREAEEKSRNDKQAAEIAAAKAKNQIEYDRQKALGEKQLQLSKKLQADSQALMARKDLSGEEKSKQIQELSAKFQKEFSELNQK